MIAIGALLAYTYLVFDIQIASPRDYIWVEVFVKYIWAEYYDA
jgi:hypothetical protein